MKEEDTLRDRLVTEYVDRWYVCEFDDLPQGVTREAQMALDKAEMKRQLEALISQHQALRDIDSRIDEVKRTPTALSVFNYDFEKKVGITQQDRLAELKKKRKDGHNG